jgi:PilZ domain-containing protein
MDERRGYLRIRTFKGGAITTEIVSGQPCTIRNLSEAGACIATDGFAVPDQFSLIIKPEMKRRTCQVVWRSGDLIGVQFI